MNENLCKVCGRDKGRNKWFCSKICESIYRQHKKKCKVCGKLFNVPPSSDIVCCSVECARINRQLLHGSGRYEQSIKQMMEGTDLFLLEHSGEKHVNAKFWIIKSPTGEIYKCKNLSFFIRSHPELFDGTAIQAFDGFAKIKATMLGKKIKNKSYSWKGWKLISWR